MTTQFPAPLSLPPDIPSARAARIRDLIRASIRGVSIRVLIIVVELIGYVFLNSSALLVDALATLVDVAATLFLIFCIKLADRPPDEDHPFGHGRVEPLGGLQCSLLLVIIGLGMLFQQTLHVVDVQDTYIINSKTWLIPFGSMILLEACYRFQIRAAKRQHSPALLADAIHYRIDGLNSLLATVALILASFYPEKSAFMDHMGALSIALLMVGLGVYAARENLHQLMDRIPGREYFDKVERASLRVSGVLGTEKIRIQQYGPDAHVDIDIEVDPESTVRAAHEVSQQVRHEIQKEWPFVRDVTVHIEPYYPGDH